MRPHVLELTAFGPFAGSEQVEFDDLADAGLFLLHGDTGAGKSTLLDAISYALFGSVPGARGRNPRLRSDHAEPGVAPQVRLEFSVGARRLRITRQPAWKRPKQRGSGTTEAKPSVLLERWDGAGWTSVSTRFDEVGEEISQIVGMTAEQFCQVVLLPQGGFAHFLHAKVEERAELLQRLFGTERFRQVERWLRNQARDLVDALGEDQRQIGEYAATIRGIATDPSTGAPADAGSGQPLDTAGAVALLEAAEQHAKRAAETHHQAEAEWRQARDDHDAVRVRLERAQNRRTAEADLARLTDEGPAYEALTAELARARAAAPIEPALERVAESERALAGTEAADRAARAVVGRIRPDDADSSYDEFAVAAEQASRRLATLDAMRPRFDELTAIHNAAEDARTKAETAFAYVTAARANALELAELAQAADENLVAARAAVVQVPTATAAMAELEALGEKLNARIGVAKTLAGLEERCRVRGGEMQDARQTYQDLRQRSLDSMASRLAQLLSAGDACPVCGGTEHPAPAVPDQDAVTDAQVTEAEGIYEQVRTAVGDLEQQIAGVRQELTSLDAAIKAAFPDGADLSNVLGRVEVARHELERVRTVAETLESAEATAAAIAQERQNTEQAIAAQQTAYEAATELAERDDERARALDATLTEHLDGMTDFDTAVAAAILAAEAFRTAHQYAAAVATCRSELDAAYAASRKTATKAGFADLEAAMAAARTADVVAEMEDARQRYATALGSVKERLAALEADATPLDELTEAATAASARVISTQTEFENVGAVRAIAENTLARLADLVPEFTTAVAGIEPQLVEVQRVRDLADLAAGDGQNHRNMALSSYVLAARLEQVAAAASERLLRMTSGRYELLHADTAPDARRHWGLGLRVRDGWTGEERETGSLSGGETFLASLALALGLADVVTAEAGGAHIDTLFVDEGFGSLDENTLDEVLTVLDGLREGGRMVGLVSHVSELRQRIPVQIEVRKTPTGSTVRRPRTRAA